jgi:hypothetical protein
MIFCIVRTPGLPEYRQSKPKYFSKSLKENAIANGMSIACKEVPVMYRLLEKSGQPNEQQSSRRELPPTKRPSTMKSGRDDRSENLQ